MSSSCLLLPLTVLLSIHASTSSDITNLVFGKVTDGIPAAFGDFNSDELTDIFMLRDGGQTLEILLAHEEEPLLRPANPPLLCTVTDQKITSVVPGDFDGDALMDVMITTIYTAGVKRGGDLNYVKIFFGGANQLNCTNDMMEINMTGQPLAIDYNQDMIIDLFGMDANKKKMFWIFNANRLAPEIVVLKDNHVPNKDNIENSRINRPHSNAFLDLNHDFMADLFLTTTKSFEIWLATEQVPKFTLNNTIQHPEGFHMIGQSLFIDVELKGALDLLTPVCSNTVCDLLVFSNGGWHRLHVKLTDDDGKVWNFASNNGILYLDVITLRSGDFNMDGYPDILATLQMGDSKQYQSFLLENVPCNTDCGKFKRTYQVKWNLLSPFQNGTTMAAFFDFYQDGILDVILVTYEGHETYKVAAFKNSLDYDANFVKVMVLTGLSNENNAMIMGRVGKKRRTYGTNLPGPFISYKTTTQEGHLRHGAAAQLPQSAHFSLNLPYSIFGLGRTPNFVDTLTVGLSNHSRAWTQIIPNSQMVVIPWPTNKPGRWKAQLFVTPSKLILMSVAALTGICGIITVIIGVLYWKERQEDKKERLSESHRFHFDAM